MTRPYTNDQKEIARFFPIYRVQILDNLLSRAREAYDTIVKLPATNEDGEKVIHGCNLDMVRIFEEFCDSAKPLFHNCTEEEQEKRIHLWGIDPRTHKVFKRGTNEVIHQ